MPQKFLAFCMKVSSADSLFRSTFLLMPYICAVVSHCPTGMWGSGVTLLHRNVGQWCHTAPQACGAVVSHCSTGMWGSGVTLLHRHVGQWCHTAPQACGAVVSHCPTGMWGSGVTLLHRHVRKACCDTKTDRDLLGISEYCWRWFVQVRDRHQGNLMGVCFITEGQEDP